MHKQFLAAALTLAATGAVMAQASLATITDVSGLVTVSSNNQFTNATAGMPLPAGAQVLSTGSGSATIQFSNGCVATLKPGQSLAIAPNACETFMALNPAGGESLFTVRNVALGAAGLGVLYGATRGKGRGATVTTQPGSPAVVVLPVSGS